VRLVLLGAGVAAVVSWGGLQFALQVAHGYSGLLRGLLP
jgi:hypothetical protein